MSDAQTHSFAPGEIDVVISQFGLMFFDDPDAAFANLHSALVGDGRLGLICWQDLAANEWLMVVGRAVAKQTEPPVLGGLPGGPGMFALEEPDETAALLAKARFGDISVEPVSTPILLAGGAPLDESMEFLRGMGMVKGLLGRVDGGERDAVLDEIGTTLATHEEAGVGVRLGAAGWLVTAHA